MSAPSLKVELSSRAAADVLDTVDWLTTFAPDVAARFPEVLDEALLALSEQISERIAEGRRPALPNEDASLAFSRPAYESVFTTGKTRKRRSSSGAWRILYEVLDADADGQLDTLHVLGIRHARARPLWRED